MALLARKITLIGKTESSYGVDSSPSGSANAILVRELEITPLEVDEVERTLVRAYLGNYETLLGAQRATMTFSIELAGSGAAGTANQGLSVFLKACGFSETVNSGTSVVYAPVSSAFSSATIGVNLDGTNHQLTGARGTFSINCSLNEVPTVDFEFTGKYNNPAAATQPTQTYQNQADPVLFKSGNTSAFQYMGNAAALEAWSLDLNNEVVHRKLVGGTEEVMITDRKPSGTLTIEAPALGSFNYWTKATSEVTGNNTFQHGQTAGNIVTISAPYSSMGAPTYGDSDGVITLESSFTCSPSGAGNNELTLTFT
tara:strand:+ start:2100 stop:3038 length:939 start_codon:yes stop_codon:yes gene_type:complete